MRTLAALLMIAALIISYTAFSTLGHDAQTLQTGVAATQQAFQVAQPKINQADAQLQRELATLTTATRTPSYP